MNFANLFPSSAKDHGLDLHRWLKAQITHEILRTKPPKGLPKNLQAPPSRKPSALMLE